MRNVVLTFEGAADQTKQLVRGGVRIVSTVPSRGRIVGFLPLFLGLVYVENPIEFSEHQTEYPCGDSQCWTEHDPNIPHCHLVCVRVLDDEDQVSGECSKE